MLYRKYRPQIFSDVVGQEHVTQTLKGALSSGRVGHAYLFCGPRGTGKTTVARLLAKTLNCQARTKDNDSDNKCSNCIDLNEGRSLNLIEIDAASNRGIDEIRNIKESAGVASLGGGYKIFIIDEVHMLTQPAFNALLKVLEEPPAHVVFIMATTEPHKVLPTVLSRAQRFDFKKLSTKEIVSKLKDISKSEKLSIEDDAIITLALSADGALRDAEVALSKVLAFFGTSDKITDQKIVEFLGLIPHNYHSQFLSYILAGDKESAVRFIENLTLSGADADNFTKEFIEYLKRVLIHKLNPAILVSLGDELLENDAKIVATYANVLTPGYLVKLINTFISAKEAIKTSPIPQLPLELAVVELLN